MSSSGLALEPEQSDCFPSDTLALGTIHFEATLSSTKVAETRQADPIELKSQLSRFTRRICIHLLWVESDSLPISGDGTEFSLRLQSHFWEVESGGSPSAETPHLAVFASPHHGSRLCQGAAVAR